MHNTGKKNSMSKEVSTIKTLSTIDSTSALPFETQELRRLLEKFLDTKVINPHTQKSVRIGSFRVGVYAFYDYDDEPIYIGQTKESLGTRIRRHLTNQRTDAVAMNVLDPYEVCTIKVWPLTQFSKSSKDIEITPVLNSLEHLIYSNAIEASTFKAVLNEKAPPLPSVILSLPESYEARIVSDRVSDIRDHPDIRVARRAQTIARLAQVISERKVNKGLRIALLTQAKRLQWLAQRRIDSISDSSDSNDDE